MKSTVASPSASLPFFGNSPLPASRAIAASAFLAGDESVSIIPSFSHSDPLGLISGQVGPFRAGMDTVVPLWLATLLCRRKLAKIVAPPWMDPEVLKEVLRFERDPREESFSPLLPFRHAEIAHAVLSAASGLGAAVAGDSQIPEADKVKLLLEDIATVRMDKIRKNVHTLSSQTLTRPSNVEPVIDVTRIGSLEMHAIKPFVTEAFRMHRELLGKGTTGYTKPLPLEERSTGLDSSSGRASSDFSNSNGALASGRSRLRSSRLVTESEDGMSRRQNRHTTHAEQGGWQGEEVLGNENVSVGDST